MKHIIILFFLMMSSLQTQTIHSLINTGDFIQAYEMGLTQANVAGSQSLREMDLPY